MGGSPHLAGMSTIFKRKALLMALDAAGTDVGEVLNDVVTRQRALKEYEESYLEKVTQFEASQMEQNRLQKAELDRITAQFKSRIDASLAEVDRWHQEFREWQKVKQQELQRLTDAAALCVPHESEEEDGVIEGKVMAIAQRAGLLPVAGCRDHAGDCRRYVTRGMSKGPARQDTATGSKRTGEALPSLRRSLQGLALSV